MFMKRREKILDTGPRICFFVQTAFGTAFSYLTSGVFLSGLALLMGAGDVLVSYLKRDREYLRGADPWICGISGAVSEP